MSVAIRAMGVTIRGMRIAIRVMGIAFDRVMCACATRGRAVRPCSKPVSPTAPAYTYVDGALAGGSLAVLARGRSARYIRGTMHHNDDYHGQIQL